MKKILIAVCLLLPILASAITTEEIQFLLDKEQFTLLEKHSQDIEALLSGNTNDLKLALEYAQRADKPALELKCLYSLAMEDHSLQNALQWIILAENSVMDSLSYIGLQENLRTEFNSPEDTIILDNLYGTPEEEYLEQIRQLRGYNPVIEDLAKSWIDEISVEPSDSLATAMISRFEYYFPLSQWAQVAYYYHLFHLARSEDYHAMNDLITSYGNRTSANQYISAIFLMSPTYRKSQTDKLNIDLLDQAKTFLDAAVAGSDGIDQIQVLYDTYNQEQWLNRLLLTQIKIGYYKILAERGLFGDEEELTALFSKPTAEILTLCDSMENVNFANNDAGDIAEMYYWKGKILALSSKSQDLKQAARCFAQSLIYGAPRKKYDDIALKAITTAHDKLGIKTVLPAWIRKLMHYNGIVFAEYPFPDKRYTRVAIGDFDNDSYNDLLFNGNSLYHNNNGQSFVVARDSTYLASLSSNGGLWADFNKDGLLDFATISGDSEGMGEALMKNMDGSRFAKVNEKAGDIDDHFPTEGAAWVDIDGIGYPSFYTANYEKWQERSGYPDLFWYNDKGYFSDQSVSRGFRTPAYTDTPGQAGRGVAPADFDNDGKQEILVTNYRLNRNFCWDQDDSLFVDVAALDGLSGKYKEGYYGHSIGADWGDYDNDGDLDLFIANLAHPRYINISDISQLLRNDGLSYRVIDADTLYYWKFTDVTKQAGITYDELHSDPLWLDADNDGYLDLFITSVYENDRSYLYKNNGDGTFTDITYLANARVYNGWGNATADFNRDGLTDLVVGSGNGTKILLNQTKTKNKSLFVKPVWKSGKVELISNWHQYSQAPNSPAYGTRVRVTLKTPKGKKYSLIRELSSAKGTTSQNSQELHFGLGKSKVVSVEKVNYAQDQN